MQQTKAAEEINSKMAKSMLEVEYALEDKPVNSFPYKLIKHLSARFALKGKILDVMCGRGEHAQAFHKLGFDVWCVDISPAAAQEYERRAERLSLCDVGTDSLPFEDNSFDVVFCKSAIEHVNADHLISEMHRILKPGGKVIVLTLDWWYTYRMHYIDHTHGYGCPWMKHSLKLILTAYGFNSVLVENFYYLAFTWGNPWGKVLCWFVRRLPYPYIDNFTNPIWKIVRFSNELQIIGYGVK